MHPEVSGLTFGFPDAFGTIMNVSGQGTGEVPVAGQEAA